MVEYVNVGGKKTAVSDLPSNIQQKLKEQGHIDSSQVNTQQTYQQQKQQFYEQDHKVIDRKGREVSVPGRFAEKAGVKAPNRKEIREARRKKKKEEKIKAKEEEERKLKVKVHGGKEKGEKEFKDLSPKLQRQLLKTMHPVALAKKGILAPSDNIHFKSRATAKASRSTSKKVSRAVHNPVLESGLKSFIMTGDTASLNTYLAEIQRTQGTRAAAAERERLIEMGIKHTSLEGARQGAGKGSRSIRIEKEAEQRRSAQILKSGQKSLHQSMFGTPIVGQLGATFDERFAPILDKPVDGSFIGFSKQGNPIIGAPDPKTLETTYEVDGKTFKTREEAQRYAESQSETIIIPSLIPTQTPTGDAPKLPLAQFIESSERRLDEFEVARQKKLQELGVVPSIGLGILDITAVPVQTARIGLQGIAAIENTKEQFIAPLFGAKSASPITLKSSTADEVVFPLSFTDEGIKVKSYKQIIGETKEFVQKRGGSAFTGGLVTTYGVAVPGLVKSTVKVGTKLISKVPTSVKTAFQSKPIFTIQPKGVKVYPEIASQKPLTASQIKQGQDTMRRILTGQQLKVQLKTPTILSDRVLPPLTASQKQVRIVVKKPTTVQSVPDFKPEPIVKGKIFADDSTLAKAGDFIGAQPKPNTITKRFGKPLVVGEIKLPIKEFKYKPLKDPKQLTKSEFSELKFRDFIKTTEPGTFAFQTSKVTSSGLPFTIRKGQSITKAQKALELGKRDQVILPKIKKSDSISLTSVEGRFREFQKLKPTDVFEKTKILSEPQSFPFATKKTGDKLLNIKKDTELIDLAKRDQIPSSILKEKPKPVEYDALLQDKGIRPEMKRLGSTKGNKESLLLSPDGKKKIKYKIDPKVDEKTLLPDDLGDPLFKSTKINLGKEGRRITTKTIDKQKTDDTITKLTGKKGKGFKKGVTRKFDEPEISDKDRLVGSGGSVTILKDPKTTIVKPQIQKTKLEPLVKKPKPIKSKSPRPIILTKESDAVLPKTKTSPVISLFKPQQVKKKKKKGEKLSSVAISGVAAESVLLHKDRPQLKTKSKQDTQLIPLLTTGSKLYSSTKQKEKQKLTSGLMSKERIITKQQPVFKQQPKLKPKQDEVVIFSPKLKTRTKQTPKLKTRTPQRFPPKTPQITVQKQPPIQKLITPQEPIVPPPTRTVFTPPPPPKITPRPKKERKKKKEAHQEDFFGSTHESDVFGFRSKTADFAIGKKRVARVVAKERKRERRLNPNVGIRNRPTTKMIRSESKIELSLKKEEKKERKRRPKTTIKSIPKTSLSRRPRKSPKVSIF